MKLKTNKKDNTRNERQARRREREKKWLHENGWKSWEALHSALMNGTDHIISAGATKMLHLLVRKLGSNTKEL